MLGPWILGRNSKVRPIWSMVGTRNVKGPIRDSKRAFILRWWRKVSGLEILNFYYAIYCWKGVLKMNNPFYYYNKVLYFTYLVSCGIYYTSCSTIAPSSSYVKNKR